MIAIAIYTAFAALVALAAQAFRPNDALSNQHHRRIYWAGAVVGLIGACTGLMIL